MLLVAVLPVAVCLVAGTASAQQNLFNVPNGRITDPGKIFFQQQFNFSRNVGTSNTTLDVGLGDGWEFGLNYLDQHLYINQPASSILTDPQKETGQTGTSSWQFRFQFVRRQATQPLFLQQFTIATLERRSAILSRQRVCLLGVLPLARQQVPGPRVHPLVVPASAGGTAKRLSHAQTAG